MAPDTPKSEEHLLRIWSVSDLWERAYELWLDPPLTVVQKALYLTLYEVIQTGKQGFQG